MPAPFTIRPSEVGEGAAVGRAYAPLLPLETIDAVLNGRKTVLEGAEEVFQAWARDDAKRPLGDDRLKNPVVVYVAVLGLLLERIASAYPITRWGSRKEYIVEYSRDGKTWVEWGRHGQHVDRWFPHKKMMRLADDNIDFHWRTTVSGTPVVIAVINAEKQQNE